MGVVVAGAISSPLIDRFHNYKVWIVVSLGLTSVSTAVLNLTFSLFKLSFIPVAVFSCISGFTSFGLIAIVEATIEITYPVPEATVMGLLFSGLNLMGVVFIFLFQLFKTKSGNLIISAWVIVGTYVISTVLMLIFNPNYKRYKKHTQNNQKKNAQKKKNKKKQVGV